ncbi:MAG: RES family NAD+ phosphorylase [Bacteriovoracaceae bacterium]|nr:RES family NAD+ phosphorylase [Bacteriovoracaceae bacterium]
MKQLDEFLKKSKLSQKARDFTFRKIIPEYFIDQKLKAFEQANEAEKAYCDLVENYLQRERENILDDINTSLLNNVKLDFINDDLSRIVRARFSKDPLCTLGSVKKPPGGRFNFGQTTRGGSNYFQALYLGSDYETAFNESFHSQEESIGDFAHFKVKANIDRYIDLRSTKAIDDFFRVISTIKIPQNFLTLAKDIDVEPMSLCASGKELYTSIFSDRYKAWDTWVDQFSTSQWFGYYVYSLGIPAIVYPSVRNKVGFNIVIFMDNLRDTDNFITFKDPESWEQVSENRKYINSDNQCDLQRSILKP